MLYRFKTPVKVEFDEQGNEITKPTRHYSSKQEKQVAKSLGGKVQKNSGATTWQKSDILLDNWVIECKTTTKEQKSFSIKEEWLLKNKQEALFMGKEFEALVFNFGPGKRNYVVVDELIFQELLENFEK
jgi:hypothetical protein